MRRVSCCGWLLVGWLALPGSAVAVPRPRPAPDSAAKWYQTKTVWSVGLTFTPEQWAALEPAPPSGGPGGAAPRSPGPSMLLVPAMMKDGDADRSGTLSKAEFQALATQWFARWDAAGRGSLDAEQLGTGLASLQDMGAMLPSGDKDKRGGLAAMMGIAFPVVHADLDVEGQTFSDVGVRYKGNFSYVQSRHQLKRSLKVDLDKFVAGQALAGQHTINLHSNVTDASWMNEVLSYQLYRDAGVPASRTTYARVALTVPGKYDHQNVGLYSVVEAVDEDFARERFGVEGGAIFKPTTSTLFTDLGEDWAAYERVYEPKRPTTPEQSARLIEFCKFVSHAPDAEFAAKLEQYLDVEAFARYMAVTVHLSTLDSLLVMGQNFHVYLHPKTRQFSIIPWDLDHSFGQFPMVGIEAQEQLPIDHPWQGDKPFLARVFQVEAFETRYRARLKELNQGPFKPERIAQQVDALAKVLRPAVQAESADKLARFDRVVAGERIEPLPMNFGPPPSGPPGTAPAGPPPPQLNPVRPIKAFARARSRSVAEQLAGKSQGLSLAQASASGGGFNPSRLMAPLLMHNLDANQDGQLSRDEFVQGFGRWFDGWGAKDGAIDRDRLSDGLNDTLKPPQMPPPPPARP